LLAVRYRAALRTNDLIGGRYLLSPFTRAVLIMAVSTVIAISASMSVIYVTDLVLPDFDARFDNYASHSLSPSACRRSLSIRSFT
jgi:hypothetical protein